MVCGLNFSTACGILVLQPGIEPRSSAGRGRFLITGPLGKSQRKQYFNDPAFTTFAYIIEFNVKIQSSEIRQFEMKCDVLITLTQHTIFDSSETC